MTENDKRRELMKKVIIKAWKDEAFKKKLIKNPKETLNEFGVNLPENKEMRVLEETDETTFLVIPKCPSGHDQLDNSELERLTAGHWDLEGSHDARGGCLGG